MLLVGHQVTRRAEARHHMIDFIQKFLESGS